LGLRWHSTRNIYVYWWRGMGQPVSPPRTNDGCI